MRTDLFQPTVEGEARILVLIEAFSRGGSSLEGRTKLAKLDFFLRYPAYLRRILIARGAPAGAVEDSRLPQDIETRMVRYRYGPWDPAYYAILGRLVGKGLVEPVPGDRGIGYRVTLRGREIARLFRQEPVWEETIERLGLLKR